MTLFKVLTSKDGEGGGSQSSSSSPPEAIQLHSNRVIDFLHGTTVNLNPNSKNSGGESKNNANQPAGVVGGGQQQQSRYYSALSYQAIQTQRDFDGLISSNKSSSATTAAGHQRPDLGVWDCRVNETNGEASAMLLKRVVMNSNKKLVKSKEENAGEEKKGEDGEQTTTAAEDKPGQNDTKSPPIVMTVDLSDPTSVQPTIEQMRNVILNIYDEKSSPSSSKLPKGQSSATTTIKALQSSIFGKTLIQEEVTVKGAASGSNSESRIALIMAVIVPPNNINKASSTSTADEYKERQERALLLYHLHKFALEVNCTLCFVGAASTNAEAGETGEEKDEGGTGNNNDPLLGRSTTMSIDELSVVIRRVAMGLSPVEESDIILDQSNEEEKGESNENEGKEDDDTKPQRPPSIHVPGSHDAELIHGAYLRNASCEGIWDASKDDLNVALPPRTSSVTTAKEGTKDEKNAISGSSGDEEWLSQLASSIGLSPESAASALSPKASSSAAERSLTPERSKKKERSAIKKRVTRGASTRNKEAKTPKDEKEVLNFFDNLLKK